MARGHRDIADLLTGWHKQSTHRRLRCPESNVFNSGRVLVSSTTRGPMLERLRSEIVTATRSLTSTPVPVAAAVLTLAVAVGVNLAMYGLIGRALLNPPAHVV